MFAEPAHFFEMVEYLRGRGPKADFVPNELNQPFCRITGNSREVVFVLFGTVVRFVGNVSGFRINTWSAWRMTNSHLIDAVVSGRAADDKRIVLLLSLAARSSASCCWRLSYSRRSDSRSSSEFPVIDASLATETIAPDGGSHEQSWLLSTLGESALTERRGQRCNKTPREAGRVDNLFVLCTLRPAVVEVATGTSWKAIRRFAMVGHHRMTIALMAGAVICVLAGCQATSTAGPYHPANCAMVGSRCSSNR